MEARGAFDSFFKDPDRATALEELSDSFSRLRMPLHDECDKGAMLQYEQFAASSFLLPTDDGDTRSPSSGDGPADLSSGGGSDDETRGGSSFFTSAWRSQVPEVPALPASLLAGLDDNGNEEGDGLIDLDPDEGRRRGGELLSMLFEKPAEASPALSRRDKGCVPPSIPPPPPPRPMQQQEWQLRQEDQQHHAWVQQGGRQSEEVACSEAELVAWGACLHTQHAEAICKAAQGAFGADFRDVASSAGGGFVVWLTGPSAAQIQRGHEAVLNTLGAALWPQMGQEILGMEQREADSSAASRLSGVASAVASSRLTVWCIGCDLECARDLCWDYARQGICPRSGRCRWLHVVPPSYPVNIEVASC
mmetsp:Transcript_26195/g.55508  ORF Transcript_26195/g.55508 Transcript_26195/m.55508 type:complete len:363 (-) Transcript_26195:104-1192(-)